MSLRISLKTCLFSIAIMGHSLFCLHGVKAEDILSESASFTRIGGVQARKGTIAATIKNIAALNQLTKDSALSPENEELQQILADQRSLIPALYVVDFFDLLDVEEWYVWVYGEGRVFVRVLLLQQYPSVISDKERGLLEHHRKAYTPALQAEIDLALNLSRSTKI